MKIYNKTGVVTLDNGQGDTVSLTDPTGEAEGIRFDLKNGKIFIDIVASDAINSFGRSYELAWDGEFNAGFVAFFEEQIKRLALAYPEFRDLLDDEDEES